MASPYLSCTQKNTAVLWPAVHLFYLYGYSIPMFFALPWPVDAKELSRSSGFAQHSYSVPSHIPVWNAVKQNCFYALTAAAPHGLSPVSLFTDYCNYPRITAKSTLNPVSLYHGPSKMSRYSQLCKFNIIGYCYIYPLRFYCYLFISHLCRHVILQ